MVGSISPWVRPDSSNVQLRKDSTFAVRQELEWAQHLGLQAVIHTPSLHQHGAPANIARLFLQVPIVLSLLSFAWVTNKLLISSLCLILIDSFQQTLEGSLSSLAIWIRIPLSVDEKSSLDGKQIVEKPIDHMGADSSKANSIVEQANSSRCSWMEI